MKNNIKTAVILAAGKSSRFYPFTTYAHKSLIPLMGKTLLEHTVDALEKSSIEELLIVKGPDNTIPELIGNRDGLKITYITQPEPLGQGDALLRVKEHITSSFYLLHAAHMDFPDFYEMLAEKQQADDEVVLLAKHNEADGKYGILQVEDDRVLDIMEKPTRDVAPSNLRIIGIYLLTKDFFETLSTVPLEHYSLEAAIATYGKTHTVRFVETDKPTISLKYPWDLLHVGEYLLNHMEPTHASSATIGEHVSISGNVTIGENVRIYAGAVITGPCYIGANAVVGTHAILRDNVILEEGSVIGAHMEVRNSVLFKEVHTHSGFIGDSVIGPGTKIAAGVHTANVRIDRSTVKVTINDQTVDSGLKRLGLIAGGGVMTGIHLSTMPGVVIGRNSVIGPSTTVMKNVPDNTRFYTTFHEVVEKPNETEQ